MNLIRIVALVRDHAGVVGVRLVERRLRRHGQRRSSSPAAPLSILAPAMNWSICWIAGSSIGAGGTASWAGAAAALSAGGSPVAFSFCLEPQLVMLTHIATRAADTNRRFIVPCPPWFGRRPSETGSARLRAGSSAGSGREPTIPAHSVRDRRPGVVSGGSRCGHSVLRCARSGPRRRAHPFRRGGARCRKEAGMKKLGAEFFGTFWLVLGGCGSAVLAAAFPPAASWASASSASRSPSA